MLNLNRLITGIIIVLAIFSGVVIKWQFDKDFVSLYRDGTIIAKEKWVVEAQRTSFLLDSWYDRNVKCPKVIDIGGHISGSGKSCIYPDNHFEKLSRSLINTKVDFLDNAPLFTVVKSNPQYKYGTRGAYAGFLTESFTFDNEVEIEQEFPIEYIVNWKPRDTRFYRLIWRIESLKNMSLWQTSTIIENVACTYNFGNVEIDLKDECSKLEKVEINTEKKRIWFYFKKQRFNQLLDISLVDPPSLKYTTTKVCDIKTTREKVDVYGMVQYQRKVVNEITLYINTTICDDFPLNLSCRQDTVTGKGIEIHMEPYYVNEVVGSYFNLKNKSVNCRVTSIKTKGLKLICPSWVRCDIIKGQICIEDCGRADCNFAFDKRENWGWDGVCIDISDFKNGKEIEIVKSKNLRLKIEKV